MISKSIHTDNEILGGKPVFFGTRVPIQNLYDYLESGESIDDFINDFDTITKKQVVQVLEISKNLIINATNILNENFVR